MKVCNKCNQEYEDRNGDYNLDGEIMCPECFKSHEKIKYMPFFVTNIPTFVEGATCRVFTFKDSNDFYEKIKERLDNGCILVKATGAYRGYLLSQSIEKSFWWMLGAVNNFNINLLNIPETNYNIYKENKEVDIQLLKEWLNGKTIVTNE